MWWQEYLASIGRVHIASADPHAPPDFDCGYLTQFVSLTIQFVSTLNVASSNFDLIAARWAYKRSREYMRRMACYRGDHAADHPKFAVDSPAAPVGVASPVPARAPDLVYSEEDDKAIDAWHRKTGMYSVYALFCVC